MTEFNFGIMIRVLYEELRHLIVASLLFLLVDYGVILFTCLIYVLICFSFWIILCCLLLINDLTSVVPSFREVDLQEVLDQ